MKAARAQPGFPHKDTSWLLGLIAVRAPLIKVRQLAAAQSKPNTRQSYAFQIGDDTLLSWVKCEPDLAKWLSKKLKTTAAYVWDEDTSGWFGYSIFKGGTEMEVFQF